MEAKIHVGNLPDNCPRETLRDLFGPYGTIDDVLVIKNYGFVTFTNKDDAEKAMQDLHKTKLLGNEITVQHAKPKRSDENRTEQNNRRDHRNDNRSRDNRRSFGGRDDRQRNDNMNNPANILSQLGQLSGILGAAPGAASVPALGLLTTLNAAVAGQLEQQNMNRDVPKPQQKQQSQARSVPRDQPDPDVRVRREVVHVREVPQAAELGLKSGYVIHERYYVDPSHPLLRGIPLSDLPRINDPKRSSPQRERERERERPRNREPYQNENDYYSRDGGYSERPDRSPIRNRDFDYDRY